MSLREKLRRARHSTEKISVVIGETRVTSYLKILDMSCGHEVPQLCNWVPKYCPECGRKVVAD